jgi:hypothetical protein
MARTLPRGRRPCGRTAALPDGPDPPDAFLAATGVTPPGCSAPPPSGASAYRRADGRDRHRQSRGARGVAAGHGIDIQPGLQGAAAAEMRIARLERGPCARAREDLDALDAALS